MFLLCIDNHNGRKRRSNIVNEVVYPVHEVVTIQPDEGIIPKPFNISDYLSHLKKHRQTRSTDSPQTINVNRYVLFILDGSGSIGSLNFKKMKAFVSDVAFIFQFCGFTAVMTYNDCAYLEYNFTDFRNVSHLELGKLKECIDKIEYRGGVTASGNAIREAYLEVLNKSVNHASEIDIIFITDGHSNTGDSPCREADDYWNKLRKNVHKDHKIVHVYPIGIGSNVNHTELHCIMGEDPEFGQPLHILDFDKLQKINDEVVIKLLHTKDTTKFCARFDTYEELICSFAELP